MESTTRTATPGEEVERVAESTTTTTDDAVSPRLSALVMAETMSLLEEQDPIVQETVVGEDAFVTAGGSTNDNTAATTTAPKPKAMEHKALPTAQPKKTYSGRTGEAVSVERKEQLLLEARVNRLQWIHQVPLPYRKSESPDDPWVQENGLANYIKTCHAAAFMPSMTKVLSHLYGMDDQRTTPEDIAHRIENLVSSLCPCRDSVPSASCNGALAH